MRAATVTTVLGRMTVERARSACPHCGARQAPLDQQVPIAAGGFSLGLPECLALLGATQDAFTQARAVLARLGLVPVCPNSVRAATEDLGALRADQMQEVVRTVQASDTVPPLAHPQLYVHMDGVLAHTHADGGKGDHDRLRLHHVEPGTTRAPRHSGDPGRGPELCDHPDRCRNRWLAALARIRSAREARIDRPRGAGDGAHGMETLAADQFPQATPILDGYHASPYIWRAAATIFGESSDLRSA